MQLQSLQRMENSLIGKKKETGRLVISHISSSLFSTFLSISSANVRSLTPENISWLLLPAREWLARMDLHQANYCSPTTTLKDAITVIKGKHCASLRISA